MGTLAIAGSTIATTNAAPADDTTTSTDTDGTPSAETDGATSTETTPSTDTDDEDDGNETVRHQDPDEYEGTGGSVGVDGWLSDRLLDRLEDSTIEVSEGQADLAREFLGDEYQEYAEQYSEVSGQAEDGAGVFDEVGEEHERFVDAIAEYQELRDEYDDARGAGNDLEARQYARALQELAEEIEERSENLTDQYEEIEEETDRDVSMIQEEIEGMNRSIQEEQAEIEQDQFFQTELTLEVDDANVSYLEPLTATGELREADGSAIANEEIGFDVGNHTEYVETDDSGSFELTHRPRDLPLETDEVTVEFVPDNESAYLGSEATVDVSVEQVEPTITDLTATDEVTEGETIDIRGNLSVSDEPVDDVPLSITLAGQDLGTVEVDDGSFEATVDVTRAVPAGDHELTVSLDFEDRALARTTETTSITVVETDTDLSIDASTSGDELHLEGRFVDENGSGIENESLQVTLDGYTAETVETGADGEFNATIVSPPSADGDTTLHVVYDGSGTNLAGADVETTVTFTEASGDTQGIANTVPAWTWIGLGVAAIAIVAGTWWYRRSSGSSITRRVNAAAGRRRRPQGPQSRSDVTDALLAKAGDALASDDPDRAVEWSYVAVRRALGSDRTTRRLTHREFVDRFDERRADGLGEREEEWLREITTGYERATFDDDTVTRSAAETLFEYATRLCGHEDEYGSPLDDASIHSSGD